MEDFEKSLESFLHHIALSRTGSQDTQDAYHRDVERFLTYLQDKDIHSFEDVKKEDRQGRRLRLRRLDAQP